jgi:P27 family predicted phage terminase small subunit
MGRRGPTPKPKALKKAQGTYQKCRDRELAEVTLPAGAPPVPDDLPPAALSRWSEVVAELVPLGTLAKTDGGALEAYCRSWAQWKELQAVAAEKVMVKTPFGPKVNPASGEARKLHKEVIQPLELALGLHYAARARVKMPPKPKEEDPVEEDLFGNGGKPALTAIAGGKPA